MKRISAHRPAANLFLLGISGMFLGLAAPVARVDAQQQARSTDTSPAGNIENGRQDFKIHGCANCHGFSGQGGAGPRLVQNMVTFQVFANYARRPKGSMPPFGNQVSEAQFADIYAFLKSIPPSPDPKTIALLNERD